ncbi:MAG: TonB-dependent receptor [Caulobacterales bacterium]
MAKNTSGKGPFSALLRMVLMGSAAIGAIDQAAAQEATPTAESSDDIVVTARRPLAESDAASLQIQRNSDSLVSVISGDAIGNLPDQNIAFAIGRLPGVSIERDQGQARYVNLRGAPIRWTTLSFDGLSVVSPEGRQTRFDNIPSAIASQVIVEKAITPNMSGDTVAGNVNIRTRRAFDYDGFTVFGNLAGGYVTLGGGEEIDSSIVVANTFMNDRLGVLLQASYYTRNMVTDNWETDPYLAPPNTGTIADRFAREYENKPYRLTRQNISASARVDYRLDDSNELFASSIFTTYADDELRTNYIFRMDQGTRAAGSVPNLGTVFATRINANFNVLESREFTSTNTLGGEHNWFDFDVSWRLNYTYTQDGRDAGALPNFESPSGAANRPTVAYDFRNGADNTVRLFNTVVTGSVLSQGAAQQNIEAFPLSFLNIERRDGSDDTQAYTAKFDVTREMEFAGRNVEFAFGGLWSDRTKTSSEQVFRATAAQVAAGGLAVPTYNDIALGRSYLGEYQLGYTFRYHSQSALENLMNTYINRGIAQAVDSTSNYWKVNENIVAGYGMATIDYDWGNVVIGGRVEQIETEGRSFVGGRLLAVPNDDTLFFPSAHFNWNVTEDSRIRVGFTTSATRADFNQLRPNFSFNDSARTVSGGNPLASPERQTGFDAYFENYGDNGSFFSFGVFHKDVRDVLFTTSNVFGLDVLDTPAIGLNPAIIRSGYTFTSVANGGTGFLRGAEVFYSNTAEELAERLGLPEWMQGFGLRAGATFTQSEANYLAPTFDARVGRTVLTPRRVAIPGASDWTYNLQASYEMYGLSVRLAYQFRTPWGQSIGNYRILNNGQLVPDGNGDVFWDDDGELDLSVRYQVNDNYEVYFDGVNLLDGPGRRFADTSNFPVEYETFGERFIVGVRFNY